MIEIDGEKKPDRRISNRLAIDLSSTFVRAAPNRNVRMKRLADSTAQQEALFPMIRSLINLGGRLLSWVHTPIPLLVPRYRKVP